MSKFKVGDLVLLMAPSNSGMCVELLEKFVGPCRVENEHGFQMVPDGRVAWLVAGNGLTVEHSFSGIKKAAEKLAVGERWLIPLRGDFAPEQTKKQERPVNA